MAGAQGKASRPRYQDLKGRVFGKLTVLEYAETRGKRAYWRCRCECGKEKVICSRQLLSTRRSKTRSCGCLRNPPLEDRLRRRVTNWGCADTAVCWEWVGGTHRFGYGASLWQGKSVNIHRLVYEHYVGPIPGKMFVCHRCDNPRCCNPAHLFLGTAADNTRDMMNKGRHRVCRGEDRPNAKLTAEDVRAIRLRWERGGVSQAELGREYGVSQTVISFAVKRWTWRHVE